MIVQCSFCQNVFNESLIKKGNVDSTFVNALPNDINKLLTIKKEGDSHIGEYCPKCNKLHVVGFRKPINVK